MVRSRTGNVNQYFFTQTDTQTFFSSATQIYIYTYIYKRNDDLDIHSSC